MFDRFALKDEFERHFEDFSFMSKAMWERKKPWVYRLVMAEIYLFPQREKRIAFKITKLMFDLFLKIKNRPYYIIPIILADIFVACTSCSKGAKFLHGPNLILHI